MPPRRRALLVRALVLTTALAAPIGAEVLTTPSAATSLAPAAVRVVQQSDAQSASVSASVSASKPTHHKRRRVCAHARKGHAHCDAVVRLTPNGHPLVTAAPAGYGPADLRGAYDLPSVGGAGRTGAIVDAFDDPHAAADLATYRSTFALPACGTGDGCLTIVGQDGSSALPPRDAGWAQETSLDLDMVSAVCPDCRILLVEATSSSLLDLATAARTAAAWPGVVAVSNSYGGSESASVRDVASAWSHAGVWMVASSGDNGYGVEFPASAPDVIAVGGTTLVVDAAHQRVSEKAWSGSGSGCSRQFGKPAWQHDGCAKRSVADVAAVADPDTGLAVRDTYAVPGGGWLVVGGTSAAAPIIAALHALAGGTGDTAASLYRSDAAIFDVSVGTNGRCRTMKVLCRAGRGWDGPTGVGAPSGLAGFTD